MKTNISVWSYLAQFLLEWEIFEKEFVEKIETHILHSITLFYNRAFCEIMWKNVAERGGPQMTIWRMRIACWIPKATDTHSEYVIIIIAFPLQQWLHERSSLLCYTYIASLVFASALTPHGSQRQWQTWRPAWDFHVSFNTLRCYV